MKIHPLIGLPIILLVISCARQSSPMGGPRDEDPPELVSSIPAQETTNIKPKELELVFSEYIKLDNPGKQIIITPKINPEEVEFTAQRDRLRIQLNQELEDSTTYVFNFQKSVQDITEGNPVNNLKLVFSTGPEIDSLKFSGNLSYIFPRKNKDIVDVLVGLYPVGDTTDIFTASPYYIAQTDSLGNFEITNIKAGEYHAYAWHDDNNSLKAEFRSEAYGFLNEPVSITKDISGIHFKLFSGDLTELKVNRSSPVGRNYDIILNKFPVELEISHSEKIEELFYRINEKTIRLYHTELPEDSIAVQLSIKDSVGFSVDTTLYAKFETSDRDPEKLEITANTGETFLNRINAKLTFSKPVHFINYDSLFIQYDSAGRITIDSSNLSLPDSSVFTHFLIDIPIPDSLNYTSFTLYAADSTFLDVENLWNTTELVAKYEKIKLETLSEELSGEVETDEFPILVQLLDASDQVVQETYLKDNNQYKLVNMEAGKYKLRAIIDRNKNRRWDPGNIYEKKQPEPVYYYFDNAGNTDQVLLKASWTHTKINILMDKESGIDAEEVLNNNEIDPVFDVDKPR